jgi:hypothetical protein
MPLFSQATTGRRRVACPRRASPTAAGCLRAIPPTPWARYLTEQPAQHSQQVGCLPGLTSHPLARDKAVPIGAMPPPSSGNVRHPATAQLPHPLALDGCRQVGQPPGLAKAAEVRARRARTAPPVLPGSGGELLGALALVELRGSEPLTPCMPSMRGWFTTPHSTSRPHTSAQVRSTVRGWCRGAT